MTLDYFNFDISKLHVRRAAQFSGVLNRLPQIQPKYWIDSHNIAAHFPRWATEPNGGHHFSPTMLSSHSDPIVQDSLPVLSLSLKPQPEWLKVNSVIV